MSEVDAEVRRRAALHAALGEPVRLAIADRLTLSDASPGELGAELGLPTNLLAHHLKTLQDAGVVRRVRSEGDRRRSYVQLVLDDPLVVHLTAADRGAEPASRVVFVCTHNSARSQLAAASWSRVSDLPVASAGTHPAARVHPRAVRVGARHGLRLKAARTARLDQVVRSGDLLVAVCDNAYEENSERHVDGPRRLHWSVPDPAAADTDEAFEAAYQQIASRVGRLAAALGPVDSPHLRNAAPPPEPAPRGR